MYGLIGQMLATPGNRDALAAILLAGIAGMPGCLSYVVAKDSANPDAFWVTEVWTSQAEGSFNRRREEGKLNNDG